ncbi:MAG: polysaccharide deacetylase family protein [Gammaproteobacteria bacterium]|nr:polysaccharide deacetylase family protein [Gammaproteobacteria bacterium]
MKIFGLGKKQAAARVCGALRLDAALLGLEKLRESPIRIMTYHRVMEARQLSNYPFDSDLIEVSTEELECQLKYLTKHFDVINFVDVIAYMDDKAPLPKRPLLITFDDGFHDNYEIAFPVIKAIDVPVTMLLATDYIGGKETFWYDWLAFIVFNIKADVLFLDGEKVAFKLQASSAKRRTVFFHIINYLKGVSNEKRLQLLANLREAYGSIYDDLSDDIKGLSQPMTWENVKEMSHAGIEFGSHTATHPFLPQVDKHQLKDELQDSKKIIEQATGKAVSVVAYPNGQKDDFNDEIKAMAQELGYRIGLSYINGINHIGGFDPYEMKRMHVFPYHDLSLFKMALILPEVF